MRSSDRILIALCAATLAISLIYWWNPPGPRYYPLEHVWRFEVVPGAPSMAWYARTAFALGGGGFVGSIAYLTLGRWRRDPGKHLPNLAVNLITLLTVATLLAVATRIMVLELGHVLGH